VADRAEPSAGLPLSGTMAPCPPPSGRAGVGPSQTCLPAPIRRPDHLPLGVTGAVIAEIAPVMLLAPLAGAVIDRLPQIRVMIAADL